ncbi:D-glycerate dehydrogenase [candidate division KSB1 bacterium]|nr:D-glycerate dehydrogenase [candidate division KSB1 bacterium]
MTEKNQPLVVITRPIHDSAIGLLENHFAVQVHDKPNTGTFNETELMQLGCRADALITMLSDPVTEKLMAACPDLKILAQYAVGTDNIDLDAAQKRGIAVSHTPGVLTDATADFAFALLLAVSRRITRADRHVREGEFKRWEKLLFLGPGLQGKTLGIVGMGRIGRAFARRALGFGLKIIYSDANALNPSDAHILSARQVNLDELLQTSDMLSLHCPLTPETRHLLDAAAFEQIKPGCILINTARGPIVDESALVNALKSGRLAGAGLDVFENEPALHPELLQLENVVVAPHLASATVEARSAMARMCAESVIAALSGAQEIPHRLV